MTNSLPLFNILSAVDMRVHELPTSMNSHIREAHTRHAHIRACTGEIYLDFECISQCSTIDPNNDLKLTSSIELFLRVSKVPGNRMKTEWSKLV